MPFTPFHMGPGLLIKSLLRGAFSLILFGWCQILMDLQPLWVLVTGEGHLHGLSHTFLGSTGIALAAAASGRFLLNRILFSRAFPLKESDKRLLGLDAKVEWTVSLVSSFLGAYSHVILDAVMHSDVQPFFPLSLNNPWWKLLGVELLHGVCLGTGFVGLLLLGIFRGRTRNITSNNG